jgi:putative oxidoreductase
MKINPRQLETSRNSQSELLTALGRPLLATLFLVSGVGKIMAPAMTQAYIASAGLPFSLVSYAIAVAVELGGGVLLLGGYRTRFVALGMAVFTVVTAVLFHHHFTDQNQMLHFLKNVSIAGGLLQLAAFGGGKYSLDAVGRSADAMQ